MKKFLQIAGLAGLAIVVLGVAVGLVQQRLGLVAILHLSVGAGLAITGALANAPEIKEALTKRSLRMGPQVLLQAILLFFILLFINVIVFRHGFIKDMTNRNLFTFSKATWEAMGHLPGDVEVIGFFPAGGPSEGRQRLGLYAARFDQVKLRFVDPDKNEDLARSEGAPLQPGVLFKYGEKKVWINKYEERDITNAFIKATRTTTPKVWFTTGHREPRLDSKDTNGLTALKQMLLAQGYNPETVDLSTLDKIPEDVSMVAVVGPSLRFSDHEIYVLDNYVGQGGNAIIFLDPAWENSTVTGLENFCLPFGVRVNRNLVFDPKHHMARDRPGIWIVVTDLHPHPITDGLSEPRAVFYLARSLEQTGMELESVEVNKLVMTSADSYEKLINPDVIGGFSTEARRSNYIKRIMESGPGPEDEQGPHILAFAIKKSFKPLKWKVDAGVDRARQMRIVIMGTSSVCRNMGIYTPYNYELVINAFNWLAGEKDLKFIKSPRRSGARIYLDDEQKDRILYVSVMILPETFMIIGLAVWWRRR